MWSPAKGVVVKPIPLAGGRNLTAQALLSGVVTTTTAAGWGLARA